MTRKQFDNKIVCHYAEMYRVGMAMMSNSDEAADMVQEAMVSLWVHRELLQEVDNFKAYCCRTMRNMCLSKLRTAHPTLQASEATLQAAPGSDYAQRRIEQCDRLQQVMKAIALMPEPQRSIIKMSAFGECSSAEISEATGLTESNVRAILSRSRKRLRALFANE